MTKSESTAVGLYRERERERDCVRLVVSDPKKARKSKIDPR